MQNKKPILTNPISGFMELLPAEQQIFDRLFRVIQETYETFGFIHLDTPILERAEVLLAKAGGETEKQIYRFTKGNTDYAMRFDLTVPLARYVAENYSQLVFPFRRYAMAKVYRGERPQAGRFREFYQCDIDIIGDETLDLRFDAEIPSVINTIFIKLGFSNFKIRVNNRKIFTGLFSGIGVSDKATLIMQSIDRLEKIGPEMVEKELHAQNLPEIAIKQIMSFVSLNGSSDEILQGLKALDVRSSIFNEGIEELSSVITLIRQFGVAERNFVIDLSIARGLDYYTGTVYETTLTDYPEIGSVCSGGRYDELASHYISRKLPGVGISIGLTRLFDQLYKKGVLKPKSSALTKVLVLPMTNDLSQALGLASALRQKEIPTEVSFTQDKLKKQLRYANQLGIPFVVFVGEEEIKKGSFTMKNFQTGDQYEHLSIEEIVLKIKEMEAQNAEST